MSESQEMSELEILLREKFEKEIKDEIYEIFRMTNKSLINLFKREKNYINPHHFLQDKSIEIYIEETTLRRVSRQVQNIIAGYESLTQSLSIEKLNKEIEVLNEKIKENSQG